METSILPRLLYIGDVPVQSTVAGAALLYRLLQKYPPSHLRVVEGNLAPSNPSHRLPHVSYETIFVGVKRLLQTRFTSAYTSYLFLRGSRIPRQLVRIFEQFQPEAILTVAHGFSWLPAAALAERYKIPLHLIVHDDWPSYAAVLPWLKARANKRFGDIYRQATSRFCVSPYMMEKYQKRYGVTGSVLYPSRGEEVPNPEKPPNKLKSSDHSLVFVYAGSLNSKGYITALATLASVLENFGCSLIIYSSLTVAAIEKHGLQRSNVMVRSFIPQSELINTLVREADILFVPMTFGVEWRENMSLSFPSKLTDYTATGLPLLIFGPPYCSAVRWAKENPGVAEVVDQEDPQKLAMAVERLCQDPAYRSRLGVHASTKGQEYFSYTVITQKFYHGICS